MTDTEDEPPALTPAQRARVEVARTEVDHARRAELGTMDEASLVLLVERLRGRLDDLVRLADETYR